MTRPLKVKAERVTEEGEPEFAERSARAMAMRR